MNLNIMSPRFTDFSRPLAVALILIGSIASGDSGVPSGQDLPCVAEIDRIIETHIESAEIAGAVTGVWHRGQWVHVSARGMADIADQDPMNLQTQFAIASMTKPIVATAMMILVDEGRLNLNDPITKFVPAFANVRLRDGSPPNRPITLHDCVTHTSGWGGSQTFPGTLQEAVEELANRPLQFQPGQRWQYSPGLNIVGRVIEIVAEQPLDEFLRQRIFRPLEMERTAFRLEPNAVKNLATIYQPGEDDRRLVAAKNWIVQPSQVRGINPSGGLFSTVGDLMSFYQMILRGGTTKAGTRLLSREAVKTMTSPSIGQLDSGFTPGNTWGLGWCVVRSPQGATAMLSPGSFGHGGAFGTQGWIDPQTESIFVLLIQRTKFGNSDASDLRRDFQNGAVQAIAAASD